MVFKFNKEFYSKEAVMKAAYTYIDNYYIHLDMERQYYEISLEPKTENIDNVFEKDFENELLIQQMRNDIWEKTSSLRKMIYARALASTIIEISDEENEWNNGEENDAESILKDWFDEQ